MLVGRNSTPTAKRSEAASNRVLFALVLPVVYQEVRRLTLAARLAPGCRGVSCCGIPLRRPHRGDRFRFESTTQPARQDVIGAGARGNRRDQMYEFCAMHAAGRLARFLRSLGPQADLLR